MNDIFLICPVRNATDKQKLCMMNYIKSLEKNGKKVYYPTRDNPYEATDTIGYQICLENMNAIKNSKEVHIFWDKNSQGSLFDLGSAFALNKKLTIVNINEIETTTQKSFINMIIQWSKR